MWYLSDLTVPLALFSEKVDRDTKARMFRGEDDESKKLEKPKFPDITEKTELYDLFTRNSPEFFTIIGVDDNWLQTPVEEWDKSEIPSRVLRGGLLGLPRPPTMLQREL